jgi:hypothetical protein
MRSSLSRAESASRSSPYSISTSSSSSEKRRLMAPRRGVPLHVSQVSHVQAARQRMTHSSLSSSKARLCSVIPMRGPLGNALWA